MILHQALSGVGKGHQILHCSAPLEREERWLIEQQSDLCGQLEEGEDFAFFHTSYPCGRYRVYARTWIDRDLPRKGSVLTHSLLVEADSAVGIDDIARLDGLFRKPAKGEDRSAWGEPIGAGLPPSPPWEAEPAVQLRVLAVLFLVEQRPLLWQETVTSEAAARLAWLVTPAERRRDWSWCTRALHPRYLGQRPMHWLAPGPNSRSAFLGLRGVAIGTTLPGPVEREARAMGLDAGDPAALQAVLADIGGPADLARLRLSIRYARLAHRADLPGALGRLDVAEALGLVDTPLARSDVDRALVCLSGVEPERRPVADLAALMARRPWRRARDREEPLGRLVVETLAARIPGLRAEDEGALPALSRALAASPLEGSWREGLRAGLSRATSAERTRVNGVLRGAG